MIGLGMAISAQAWEDSRTREGLLRLANGALNTVLGTVGVMSILSIAAASAQPLLTASSAFIVVPSP